MKNQGKRLHGHYICSCIKNIRPLGKNIYPKECQAHVNCFKRLTSLWSSILCPINGFQTFIIDPVCWVNVQIVVLKA